MMILPLGLVTKTRRMPIFTVVLAIATGFFSFVHFKEVKTGDAIFWNSQTRLEYARQAQAYIGKRCELEQATTFCVGIDQISLQTYLVPKTIHFILNEGTNTTHLTHLIGYIQDELAPQTLRDKNPRLFKIQQQAEQEKAQFTKNKNLLSSQNITWVSVARSLFMHANLLHLAVNLIFMFFLAFPLEERMGGLAFLTTFVAAGAFGNAAMAFLDPTQFYVIGISASVCGLAGAFAVFFWGRYAKVLLTFFFLKSQSFYIPVLFYSAFFLVASVAVDLLLPYHNIAHTSHFIGFAVGGLIALAQKKLKPLPPYFVFPYEYEFSKKMQNNLSQYDRIKVLAEWLYYSPTNMHAFRELSKEVKRSSTNPKVNKVLNKFRIHAFPEVYRMNKRNQDFLTLLPVRWLSWAQVGHSPKFLRGLAEKFADERNFECAFKLYFLTMNEVGWRDNDDAIELFKNFKKATVDKHFLEETKVLRDRHSPFGRFITKRENFLVA